MDQEKIEIITFRDSKESFLSLLDKSNIPYVKQAPRFGIAMGAGEIVEILKAIGAASIIPSLAAIIVQWLKARSSRKIVLQTKDKKIVHIEGHTVQEIASLLELAKSLTIIDTKHRKATALDKRVRN